jgi:hypothetical protein
LLSWLILAIGLLLMIPVGLDFPVAYGHGCQAQGACCTVGMACGEGSSTPLSMMFVAVGMFGLILVSFYGRRHPPQKNLLMPFRS